MKLVNIIIFILLSISLNSQTLLDKVNSYDNGDKFKLESTSTVTSYDATYDIFDLNNDLVDILLSKKPESFTLDLNQFRIKYVKRQLSDNIVTTASNKNSINLNFVNYEGIVEDSPNSSASLYISEKGVSGVILDKDGEKVYSIKDFIENGHDKRLLLQNISNETVSFDCGTKDKPLPLKVGQVKTKKLGLDDACVKIYFEVDYDIYQNKNSNVADVIDYVNGLFSQVKLLYTAENVNIEISEIFVWDTPSPYDCSSSSACLSQFFDVRPTFNGDLGHLLSFQASGGIAYLDAVCHPVQQARRAFSSIAPTFSTVPNYSWTVMVVAHEIGHNLGSRHTHACVWNGNNTAIDGCAGFTEGDCDLPSNPSDGGTIMSYCHLKSVGINFTKGFGTQPAKAIRDFVASRDCLTACIDDDDDNDNGGDDKDKSLVKVVFRLDNYPTETSWELIDKNGNILYGADSYPKSYRDSAFTDSLWLVDGDYTFNVYDSYGDGICCDYGVGVINIVIDNKTREIITKFNTGKSYSFSLPFEDECPSIDLNDYQVTSYSGLQDRGRYSISVDGELALYDNAWKKIDFEYTVTKNTIIEFEFNSTVQGEIHGIGFDTNDNLTSSYTLKTWGTQNWGIDLNSSTYVSGEWRKYKIEVGKYYTGDFKYMFFVADKDALPMISESKFRNIKVYEDGDCQN